MIRALAILARALVILVPGISMVGCMNDDMGDLKKYVKEVKARKQGSIEPLPEIRQVESFFYKTGERRNPFNPVDQGEQVAEEVDGTGLAPDPNRRKEELESYSLDSLRMVGTLQQVDTVWALVKTKDKTIYRVKTGNFLGRNDGRITRVTENKIELTELIRDRQQGYRERQATLALK